MQELYAGPHVYIVQCATWPLSKHLLFKLTSCFQCAI